MVPTEEVRLAAVLRQLFLLQAREVLSQGLDAESDPDLAHWLPTMVRAVHPLLLAVWQRGVVRMQTRLVQARPRPQTFPGSPFAPALLKALPARGSVGTTARVRKALGLDFDLFNPRVLDAVDEAVLRFCRETNETARTDLATARAKIRALLKRGLARGEAVQVLAAQVARIFTDPARAWRIAVTEASRALHGGGLMAARESGVVERKSWLASVDACDRCLELNGREVGLDEPFWVDPKGGPYAVVLYPPLHPHCQCTWTPVL